MNLLNQKVDKGSFKNRPVRIQSINNNYIGEDLMSFYNVFYVNLITLAFSKSYYGEKKNGKAVTNYDENEWRYVIPQFIQNKWLWGEENYSNWRGKQQLKPKSVFDAIRFNVNDISFILVNLENQIPDMIKFISKLKVLSGTTISEYEKKILISKIIAFDKIKKDF